MAAAPQALTFSLASKKKTDQKKMIEDQHAQKRKGLKISLKILIPILTELSFLCQFNDMIFHKFLPGRMVFLYGTSTAGKSSITTHIKTKAKSKGLDLVVTGTDSVWELHIFDLFLQYSAKKSKFLRSHLTISEIFDCLWNPNRVLKLLKEKSIVENSRKKIQNILDEFRLKQKDLLKYLLPSKRPFFCAYSFLPALSLGKTVFVDTAADPGDIEEFFQAMAARLVHCRTDIVIVYCSPKRLMEHLYARNEEALSTLVINKGRPGAFPLSQYATIYEKTDHFSQSTDSITLVDTEIPRDLPKMCKALSDLLFTEIGSSHNSYNEREWQETQDMIRRVFELNTDQTYIKPKCHYQFLVNSGEESSRTCAKKILKRLKI